MQSVHEKILLDDEDKWLLKKYTWHLDSYGYPTSKIKGRMTNLHQVILPFKKGFITDHKDRDPLNNKRDNLRYATFHQNMMNRSMQKNNTSGYRGVVWNKQNKKWMARIMFQGKNRHLGFFDTKEEAASIYQVVARELFKEFCGEMQKSN